jgi:hypothetical protein
MADDKPKDDPKKGIPLKNETKAMTGSGKPATAERYDKPKSPPEDKK